MNNFKAKIIDNPRLSLQAKIFVLKSDKHTLEEILTDLEIIGGLINEELRRK